MDLDESVQISYRDAQHIIDDLHPANRSQIMDNIAVCRKAGSDLYLGHNNEKGYILSMTKEHQQGMIVAEMPVDETRQYLQEYQQIFGLQGKLSHPYTCLKDLVFNLLRR